MTKPLVFSLVVALAFQASAQPSRKDPEQVKADLSRAFAEGDDLSAFDVSGQPEPVVKLFDQAKYVQAGRELGDEKETHIAFIRSVARRLGTRYDLAIELYGERVRGARAAAAPRREIDARAAVALDVRRNQGISAAKRKRVERDLLATSEYLKKAPADDDTAALTLNIAYPERPDAAAARTVAAQADAAVFDENGVRNWSRLPPRAQPYPNTMSATPSPGPLQSASAGMMSWASLTSYFDWEKGKEVAIEAYTGTLNYLKKMGAMCYRFFKQALIDAGVIDVPNAQSTGLIGLRPGAARMFSQDVKKNPKILDEMGYRQVDLGKVSDEPSTVPDGSLLIYAAGCSFAHDEHGHAEITVGEGTYTSLRSKNSRLRALPVAKNELRVCHFTCTTRLMPFLRTYGKQGCLKMYVPVKSS